MVREPTFSSRNATESTRLSSRGKGGHDRPRGGRQTSDGDHAPRSAQPRPTHFISLPLHGHAGLRDRLDRFYDYVLSSVPHDAGIDHVMCQKPARIHMTLGTMDLGSDAPHAGPSLHQVSGVPEVPRRTVSDAVALLQALRPELQQLVGEAGAISLPLSGLAIMNGKKDDQAYCMYTGPGTAVDDSAMWKACLLIHDRFKSAGFVTENRPLKLHCTLINSTFRKPRRPFSFAAVLDAVARDPSSAGCSGLSGLTSAEVERLADFGTWSVGEVHLCRMGSQDGEGRYVSQGHISLATGN